MDSDQKIEPVCKNCQRHATPIKTIELDKSTHKRWVVTQCPKCDYKSDIEPYKRKSSKDYDESSY